MTHRSRIEIHGSSGLRTTLFSADGEHILCGGQDQNAGVWRVQDGQRVGTLDAEDVLCFAVSKNGRWISAGTDFGYVVVWDGNSSYKTLFKDRRDYEGIHGVDFAPDSARLISASMNRTATVWNVDETRKQVQTLHHEDPVIAAKFSPQGEFIATASGETVRLWSSNEGRLIVQIPVKVTPQCNNGIVWSGYHLFVVSSNTIKRLDMSGATVAEWAVPDSNSFSSITLPNLGNVIAYSTGFTITFCDLATHSQLGHIQHDEELGSIAFSPKDSVIAIGETDGKLILQSLPLIFKSSRLHPTFQEPHIWVDPVLLNSWKRNQLEDAESSLTRAMDLSHNSDQRHHLLAARALVRARLCAWEKALADGARALEIRPSIIAYIAQSIAYVGKGERHTAYRTCDIAFELFHTSHVTFLLLVKAIVVFMAGEHPDAIARLDNLIATVPFNSACYTVQAYMYLTLGETDMGRSDYESAIHSFNLARMRISHFGDCPLLLSLASGWNFDDLEIRIGQHLCEALYAVGRKKEACEYLLDMVGSFNEDVYMRAHIARWVSDFTQRFLCAAESDCDTASRNADTQTLSATSTPLLREWAKASLACDSWENALHASVGFVGSKFATYQVICERLEAIERTSEASLCFRQMVAELEKETNPSHGQSEWLLNFKRRFLRELEGHGDAAMRAQRHDVAISHYSALLTLDPTIPQSLLIKRSKAHITRGSWEAALTDANKAIELDPLSPWGYEMKHAALDKKGDYKGAIDAFEQMLSRILHSSDPTTRASLSLYIYPSQTRASIWRAVQDVIQNTPQVAIDTRTGRLCDKSAQAASFESHSTCQRLISSMTTRVDEDRIKREVGDFYRYAMLSHRWETDEPPYERILPIVVYDLDRSHHAHNKLRTFCEFARETGLHWAWSDTCCINKADHPALQEALVSMFKWYRGSELTIIYLYDVISSSELCSLMESVWNTRAWTFQEYHASKAVRFYNKDWSLYKGLDIANHKESPEIIAEMEGATGVGAQVLKELQPGLGSIREKLYLASKRQSTRIEDMAYSLFGIFSVSLSVIYGEGYEAVGRLLAQLLSTSGDTGILAWTGESGPFNSCLPAQITVFGQLRSPHIPVSISSLKMMTIVSGLRNSSFDVPSAARLYDQLHSFPVASFSGKRMRLPCLTFQVHPTSLTRDGLQYVLSAKADALGDIKVTTTHYLDRMESLILVHPWVDFLLDRQAVGDTSSPGGPLMAYAPPSATPLVSPTPRPTWKFGWSFSRPTSPPPAPASPPRLASLLSPDKLTPVLELVARLRQPFGALLLAQTRRNSVEYKRVAADCMIVVQVPEDAPLNLLIDNARMLDVL